MDGGIQWWTWPSRNGKRWDCLFQQTTSVVCPGLAARWNAGLRCYYGQHNGNTVAWKYCTSIMCAEFSPYCSVLGRKRKGRITNGNKVFEKNFWEINYIERLVPLLVQQITLSELLLEMPFFLLFAECFWSCGSSTCVMSYTVPQYIFRQEIFFGVPGELSEVVVMVMMMMWHGCWSRFITCHVRVSCGGERCTCWWGLGTKPLWGNHCFPQPSSSRQPPGATGPVVLSAALNGEWPTVCSDESWCFFDVFRNLLCAILFF